MLKCFYLDTIHCDPCQESASQGKKRLHLLWKCFHLDTIHCDPYHESALSNHVHHRRWPSRLACDPFCNSFWTKESLRSSSCQTRLSTNTGECVSLWCNSDNNYNHIGPICSVWFYFYVYVLIILKLGRYVTCPKDVTRTCGFSCSGASRTRSLPTGSSLRPVSWRVRTWCLSYCDY